MVSLNQLLKNAVSAYEIPKTHNEAMRRAEVLAVFTAVSFVLSDDKTEVPILDDYLFPAIKYTLAGLSAASVVLAADLLIHNHFNNNALVPYQE